MRPVRAVSVGLVIGLAGCLGACTLGADRWPVDSAVPAAARAQAAVATPVPVAVPVAVPVSAGSTPLQSLNGWLFTPSTAAPWPAVVMVHGCGGAFAKDGALGARHRMWGEHLAAHGYAALMVDSFGARGIVQICTTAYAARTLTSADRVDDAYAALAYLRQRADIQSQRIALLGWSHGGGVALDAMTRTRTPSGRFAGAVAFYPGCTSRNARAERFHPYAPVLLLIGEADDWTPAAPCKALAATVAARGEPLQIVTYPDTYHDFDNPALKTARVRTEVPNGVRPGEGVTVAPNPQAREDAKHRVLEFLHKHLGP